MSEKLQAMQVLSKTKKESYIRAKTIFEFNISQHLPENVKKIFSQDLNELLKLHFEVLYETVKESIRGVK